MTSFSKEFLNDIAWIAKRLDYNIIDKVADRLNKLRKNGGRLFIIGLGGSASQASHAVNDFRKICKIQAFSPFDNIAEMTARINDDGWYESIVKWLEGAEFNIWDMLLVLSVGGGDLAKNISPNIVRAIDYANTISATVISIVGKMNGYAYLNSDYVIYIDSPNPDLVTAYSESFQSVVLHLLVSHPDLKLNQTKWESVE